MRYCGSMEKIERRVRREALAIRTDNRRQRLRAGADEFLLDCQNP